MARLTEEQKKVLKGEYRELESLFDRIESEKSGAQMKLAQFSNSACPKCRGKDIVDRVGRVQGDLEGSVSGDFIFGFGSVRGTARGSIDTDAVLHCNGCQNEWEKKEVSYSRSSENAMDELYSGIKRYFWKLEEADSVEFDPNSLTERYESKAEKRNAILADAAAMLEQPSDIRQFHDETLMQFASKRSYRLSGYSKERILGFEPRHYAQWGCKTLVPQDEPSAISALFSRLVDLLT